jgi:hypothetical protein
LLNLGVPWYGVCFLALLFNSLGVWFAIRAAEAQAEYLTLPATVRHLTARSTAASEPQPDPHEAEIAAAHARHDTPAASSGPISGRASS